jgi:RNA polymerase sigma-70 factor, ECF subfamily
MQPRHQHYSSERETVLVAELPRPERTLPSAALATVARLRALAILLCVDVDLAEELVALTLTRASAGMNPRHFEVNLSTWLYGRLRGYYYHDYAHLAAAHEGRAMPSFARHDQADAFVALAELPAEHREALVLIEAAGCSLAEAARICRCPKDRFKELVRKARAGLARDLPSRRIDASKPASVVALFASAQSMA